MSVVWILTRAENGEGENVLGVYAEKAVAYHDFLAHVEDITRFGEPLTSARQDPDGSVHANAACDWIHLTPHTVKTGSTVTGDPIAAVTALTASSA